MPRQTTLLTALALLAAIGITLAQATRANPEPQKPEAAKPVAGLQITLDRASHGILEISLQNAEKKPIVLNLGMMLGNGIQMIPSQLHLIVTDAAGKAHQVNWKGPAGVAGRIDDFLVPLMPSAKYTVTCSLNDFFDPAAKVTIAAGDKIQVVYQGAPLKFGAAAIPNLPLWKEKAESAPVTYAEGVLQ